MKQTGICGMCCLFVCLFVFGICCLFRYMYTPVYVFIFQVAIFFHVQVRVVYGCVLCTLVTATGSATFFTHVAILLSGCG